MGDESVFRGWRPIDHSAYHIFVADARTARAGRDLDRARFVHSAPWPGARDREPEGRRRQDDDRPHPRRLRWPRTGSRVLLVDLDPQACLTYSVGLDPESLQLSLHDVLVGRARPRTCS